VKAIQFRVTGIPVRIEPVFFLVMGVLAFANGYTGALIPVFMVVAGLSVLIHELGHATAHRSFGARPNITLTGFGGVTMGPVHPRGRSLVVTLAGPGAGFVTAVVAFALSQVVPADGSVVHAALQDLIWINVIWGVFNLLPILPLDGGHLASDLFGVRPAQALSVAGAVGLGGLGFYTNRPFLGFMGLLFGSQAFQALRAHKDQPQLDRLDAVRGAILRGEYREAAEEAAAVGVAAASWRVEVTAAELHAWAGLAAGEPDEARAALDRLRAGASATTLLVRRMVALAQGEESEPFAPAFLRCNDLLAATIGSRMVASSGLLDRVLDELAAPAPVPGPPASDGYRVLQLGLHHAGRFRDAARVGELFFQREPDPLVAYNVACSWALAEEPGAALTWLDRAVDKGFRDTALLDQDSNFEAIRDTDSFRALRAWMESGPPRGDSEPAPGP